MSGGAFDYRQYLIEEIADDIEREIIAIQNGRRIHEFCWHRLL